MHLTIDQAMQKGVEAHKAGRILEAKRLYHCIIRACSYHPGANHNLGILEMMDNKVDVALPLFKTALEGKPKVEQFWLSYIEALFTSQQFKAMKKVIEQAKKVGVDETKLSDFLAKSSMIDRDHQQNMNPLNEELNYLVRLYDSKQYAKVENLAKALSKKFPKNQFIWKILAAALKQGDKLDEAIGASQKSVELSPQDAEAHFNFGNTLQLAEKYLEAKNSYEKAIALNSSYTDAYYNLAFTHKELGDLESAEVCFKTVVAQDSDSFEAHSNLGVIQKALNKLEDSVESHKRATTLNSEYALGYFNLGNSYKEMKRFGEAKANFQKALLLKPDYVEAYNNLGNLLTEFGKLEEAKLNYEKAIELNPDYAEAIFNLAINLDHLCEKDLESSALESLVRLDPENTGLRASINLAIGFFLNGSIQESKEHLYAAKKIQNKKSPDFTNSKIYHGYLSNILKSQQIYKQKAPVGKTKNTLFIIGESHSLVSHQLWFEDACDALLGEARLIKGCMQWHLGSPHENQYKKHFENIFYALPKPSKILLAIGEIDCRLDSGIIKHIRKYPKNVLGEIVTETIRNYLNYISKKNYSCNHNITIQGVPCPNIDIDNAAQSDIRQLIEVVRLFNNELHARSLEKGFGYLDLYKLTDNGDGYSNKKWHLDKNHLTHDAMLEAWSMYRC